ncbi:MAG TPA: fatty acid desaturase CarF family protein [Myxococcota bacterium]|nr:fatty acid desaturase CarF family protein [Myxococcota bacterium]
MHTEALPKHDVMGPVTRALEAGAIAAAAALVLANFARFAGAPLLLGWWLPLALAGGAIAADFASGLVHWAADTWGRESLPFFGPRFLRPFRVHHSNPDDILERDFIDCNGDVALLACPVLVGAALTPLSEEIGCAASVFLAAFGTVSLPTNLVHQWAHRVDPPRAVAWLQRRGLILSRAVHAGHHQAPYTTRYCIATGWCNGALEAIGFFPALERAITALTGRRPRSDETYA